MIYRGPQFVDGYLGVAREIRRSAPSFPFLGEQIPSAYARSIQILSEIDPGSYAPSNATRTSYGSGFTRTEDFAHSDWTKSNIQPPTIQTANPADGQLTAYKLLEEAPAGNHYITRAYTLASLASHVASVCAKPEGRDFLVIFFNDGTRTWGGWFNLRTGESRLDGATPTLTIPPVLVATRMSAPGDSYFRCSVIFVPQVTTGSIGFYLSADGVASGYTGDITKGISLWGANIRPGTVPGPYVSALGTARTISAPDVDSVVNSSSPSADCFAYQVGESPEIEIINSVRGRYTRRYARIPAPQTTEDVEPFSRPSAHGLKSGTTYGASFDSGETSHYFSSRKSVSSASTVPGTVVPGVMPSGNINLADSGGHTCSFAANATLATILSACAALTSCTGFSGYVAAGRITISWNTGTVSVSSMPAGVQLAGTPNPNWVSFVSTATVTTPDTRTLAITSHGASVGNKLALWNGDALIGLGVVASVIDANNVSVLCSDLSQPDALITHCAFAPQATVRYVNGVRNIACRRVREFFLPGVTMLPDGTTLPSLSSIPLVTVYTSGQAWFGQVLAGSSTTYVPINASQLEPFDGPIWSRVTTSIRLYDALEVDAV